MAIGASRVATAPFFLAPLTPTIGAVVEGADLAAPTLALCEALRAALLEWKVLFFRDNEITSEQHVAFARQFGELQISPFGQKPGAPEILSITYDRDSKAKENVWHTDTSWRPEPSLGSILRAVEIPSVGGDTLFADMCAAYDGLAAGVRRQIDGRKAVHDFTSLGVRLKKQGMDKSAREAMERDFPPAVHPVVRTHPETGRKALFVNAAFTRHIVGMDAAESDALLKYLYARAAAPEYQCRFRWCGNAIAFWDNRVTQHYAVSDYWPAVRRMERVSIAGDRPY